MFDAHWRDWFKAQHGARCRDSGEGFESYVDMLLKFADSSFINPRASGRDGDGGCDGLGEAGSVWYSCYGQRATTQQQDKLAAKITSDYTAMRKNQRGVRTWRFVTNAHVGPRALQAIRAIREGERQSSDAIEVEVWDCDHLWRHACAHLTQDDLNHLLPGCPILVDPRLEDLVPLLEKLEADYPSGLGTMHGIRPVPENKIEANGLSAVRRAEIVAGLAYSGTIDAWYAHRGRPEAADVAASTFRSTYDAIRCSTSSPAETMEKLYIALVGSDSRVDDSRHAAACAVTAYFFERCDIFEHPDDLARVAPAPETT